MDYLNKMNVLIYLPCINGKIDALYSDDEGMVDNLEK